jgi:tRNA-modifying protein YgfZ
MSTDWNLMELADLGVLRFRGADAVKFLQGQVSNDVERLTAERSQIAGYHNPQGRVIALLRLAQLAPEDVLAILPRELIATVASRLMKFVLRAKVKIADDSAGWRIAGLVAPRAGSAAAGRASAASSSGAGASGAGSGASDKLSPEAVAAFDARATSWAAAQFQQASAAAATVGELSSAAAQLEEAESVVPLPTASALMLPDAVHSQSVAGGTVIIRVGATPARWLVLSPAGAAAPLAGCVAADRDAWRLLDIADGEAQVYAATSEEFVAQMLNLDALDGIAFDKGCYTGQEVIARAHYRGRVKRRLQRFVSSGRTAKLTVGSTGQLTDGRAFKVVEAVQLADGRCEFLAVAPMVAGAGGTEAISSGANAGAQAGSSDGPTASVTQEANAVPTASTPVLEAGVLPLPYPLPE